MQHFKLGAILAVLPVVALAKDVVTSMPPVSATFYPQGAIVFHQQQIDLPPGMHSVSFLIPANTAPMGVPHTTAEGGMIVQNKTSPASGLNWRAYLSNNERVVLNQYDAAQEALWSAQDAVASLEANIQALQDQAQYLRRLTPSTDGTQSLEDITAIAGFLPKALSQNATERAALNVQLRDAETDLKNARNAFAGAEAQVEQQGIPDATWILVTVDVQSEGSAPVTLTTRRFVADAGWRISYDAYLTEGEGRIDLLRDAHIFQNSGQAWNDVAVRLSSSKPLQQINAAPPLRDELDIFGPSKRGMAYESAASVPMMLDRADIAATPSGFGGQTGQYDGVAVTFDFPNGNDVPNGRGLGQILPLAAAQLSVETDRYANVRHDKTAYVRTQFTNQIGEPILPGDAEFYRDGVLIGTSYIDAIASGAEHTLFFGPDETLPVDLKFLSNLKGDEGFLARSNTREEEITFSVQNLGPTAQSVVLAYALPVSVNEDLKVDTQAAPRPTAQDVDGEPGVAEWHFDLQPGRGQNVEIDMKISWPDGTSIDWRP
ncbi:MAG: mucoidy inhibitor MuiA family protein [Planktomarina sp.]